MINHGVIDLRRDTDYVGGTLPYVINNDSGVWTKPGNTFEKQWGRGGDKMNCVTQAQHNDFENFLDWMIANGKLPQSHVQFLKTNGYMDANGFVNFSDKYNSILNGTTPDGNSLVIVADDARTNGLIPQSMLAENIDDVWDVYYNRAQITPQMQALGKAFLKYFSIAYEWIDLFFDKTILPTQLKQCPIQMVVPGHSICGVAADLTTTTIEDSYDPYIKTWDRNIFTSGLKVVLTPINIKEEPMKLVSVNGTEFLLGNAGALGIADAKSAGLLAQIDNTPAEPISSLPVPQIGTLTHDDAFIIHK